MAYRSTNKTRKKKDAKRTRMMQAAIRVFAEKSYHSATIRDIVKAADVAIGTFYFYFPDKETLFAHLYEETADFLLRAIEQGIRSRATFPQQVRAGLQAYVNIAVFEPAVIQLLLVGGVGSVPALSAKRAEYRERLIQVWLEPLEAAEVASAVPLLNSRRVAEALTGAFDEVILNLLASRDPEAEAGAVIDDLVQFSVRATAFRGEMSG